MTNYGNGRGPGLEPHAETLPVPRDANRDDTEALLAAIRSGRVRITTTDEAQQQPARRGRDEVM